jgi:F-type H+-transporting ATPase subunit b
LLLTTDAGLLQINATLLIEFVTFLAMLIVLGRWVYPKIVEVAEARQRAITEQIEGAERARREAEVKITEAEKSLADARVQAQELLAATAQSADRLRKQLGDEARESAQQITQRAVVEIEAERHRVLDSVRGEIADLVVAATEKVVARSLDSNAHRELIDQAIGEVGNGNRKG